MTMIENNILTKIILILEEYMVIFRGHCCNKLSESTPIIRTLC